MNYAAGSYDVAVISAFPLGKFHSGVLSGTDHST